MSINRRLVILTFGCLLLVAIISFIIKHNQEAATTLESITHTKIDDATDELSAFWEGESTERYGARVDRVDVVFEHKDYTSYRLTTNGLVRTGELNAERGFKDDIDATVYVLNWQQPEGEQIRYVRLTAEPDHLYILDVNQEIIQGSKLILQEY